eukprot:7387379-Prymnesium_polylepis.2
MLRRAFAQSRGTKGPMSPRARERRPSLDSVSENLLSAAPLAASASELPRRWSAGRFEDLAFENAYQDDGLHTSLPHLRALLALSALVGGADALGAHLFALSLESLLVVMHPELQRAIVLSTAVARTTPFACSLLLALPRTRPRLLALLRRRYELVVGAALLMPLLIEALPLLLAAPSPSGAGSVGDRQSHELLARAAAAGWSLDTPLHFA